MRTRCTLYARAAALLVVIAALFIIPAAGHAQVVNCDLCDHWTFSVNAAVNCPITICYALSPQGKIVCQTVAPGASVKIPCPVYSAWVNTCSGPHSIVPAAADTRCSGLLKFSQDCCGEICNAPSIDVCTHLEVRPLPCLTKGCP